MLIASGFQNLLDFFIKGGFFMLLLVLLSIVAVTVIIQRAFALRIKTVMPPIIEQELENLGPGSSVGPLYDASFDNPSALGRIVMTVLQHLQWPREENLEAVQLQARHEIVRLESGLVVLEITTGVAPLLGLLGTLSGLTGIFANLGGGGDPILIARGIAEALNTTIAGLAVAAPSLIAHNYFSRKVETLAVAMEAVVADLLAKCYPAPDSSPVTQQA